MATAQAKRLISADEFMQMDLGEGLHELVRGEVMEVPPPGQEHGVVGGNVTGILFIYGRQSGHGYVATGDSAVQTQRGPDTVRGADVCFYSYARLPRDRVTRGIPPVPPDLVVEVYSPSNRPGEMRSKVNEYLAAGVLMVWVIDPATRTLAIYRPDALHPTVLGEADELVDLPELPGFHCRVADFFL